MILTAGVCAFALFFLSDWNDWKLSRRWLRVCFPAGAAILTAATVLGCLGGVSPLGGLARGAVLCLAAAFLALLIYTLFFALPAKASYVQPGRQRPACVSGVYALCRHPGVLWMAGLHICLWAGFGFPLSAALVFTGLNVALVTFEDRWVFPARLAGYAQYRQETPFLLPTARSVRNCCGAD